ncbi:MAG: radical SAM protein [Candidatus Sulfotelmatobacter sp.]
MNTFVSISPVGNTVASDTVNLIAHEIRSLPVIVISPHNQCNCRCVMCDIWRIREPEEITKEDLQQHMTSFRELGVRWVVFSGGEPQMNSQLPHLAQMLRSEGIRVTILTAGLLLESQAETIAASVDDVIVSLDGPSAVHNHIRRVPGAYEQMAAGVRALRQARAAITIRARCTVQKENHRWLRATISSAKETGLDSISFLAADLTSGAFNRPHGWSEERQHNVALNTEEVEALNLEIELLIGECSAELNSGFIVETASKLRKIVHHFRAHVGQVPDVAPRCNAPWVSAVIEASGEVRPCFFHSAIGNIRIRSLPNILNGPEALRFRANLDIATDPICRRCVCSLYIPPTRE